MVDVGLLGVVRCSEARGQALDMPHWCRFSSETAIQNTTLPAAKAQPSNIGKNSLRWNGMPSRVFAGVIDGSWSLEAGKQRVYEVNKTIWLACSTLRAFAMSVLVCRPYRRIMKCWGIPALT